MGYADSLGDYRNVKTGKTISDLLYNRMPRGLRSGYVKIVVAAPPKPPAPLPKIAVVAQALRPSTPPPPPPPPPTSAPSAPPDTATPQTAAPIIAAAAAPFVGPIAAAIPPVIDKVTEQPPVRIRVVPDVSLAPAPSSGTGDGTSSDASLPDVSEASVTSSASPLDSLKSLPPVALAAIAGAVLFLFSRRR